MAEKLTMAAVAKALGVHQTTVSLALRGHASIPAETRERVARQAQKMGYRPNPLVSALMATRRRGKTRGAHSRLALLTWGKTREAWRRGSPNYTRLFRALGEKAEERGYGVEEFWLNDPKVSPERLRHILLQRGIRGVIVAPQLSGEREIMFDLTDVAAVALRYTLQRPALDRVSIDYVAAMQLALEQIRAAGHGRLAFATTGNIDRRVNHLSIAVYLATRWASPEALAAPAVRESWTREEIRRWVKESKAEAVIVSTVEMREAFRNALPKRELALYTLDCHVDSGEPGVMQDVEAEARAAIEFLTGRVERAEFGLPKRPQTILISGTWRGATAAG